MSKNVTIQDDLKYITSQEINWSLLEDKTVLITGANGFLAAYMTETILYLNDSVFSKPASIICLVRNIENAKLRFDEYWERDDIKFVVADLSEPITIEDKVNYIVHAASQASPKFYGIDPVGTILPNVIGTQHLLNFAKKNPIESFLFFSSGEVYGQVEEKDIPIKESFYGYLDCMQVRACYGESKRMGETMCVSWHQQYGVPVKIIRPFHTYGPGMKLDDGRVFVDFVANVLDSKDIEIKSDGKAIRPYCYIADAVSGFFTVLLSGKNAEAYNVGNPYGELSVTDLANMLVNLFPQKKLTVKYIGATNNNYLKSPIIRNSPAIDKIMQLGWKPAITPEEGFKRTIFSYSN